MSDDSRKMIAAKHNLKLSVRCGGHSNAAYCINKGGVVLDIRSLNNIEIDPENMEIAVGGGALWGDVYRKLHDTDKRFTVVGGQCPTVGVGGFLLGGGISPFSRAYGTGIDNIFEVTIVTAKGESVTIRPGETDVKKSDLFWTLRGGGGGNFGVATRFRLKLHLLNEENGKVVCSALSWTISDDHQRQRFLKMINKFNNTNWSNRFCGDAVWHYEDNQLHGKITILYNGDKTACGEEIYHLLEFDPIQNTLKEMHLHDWGIIDREMTKRSNIHHHHASFIFPKHGITPEAAQYMTDWMDSIKEYEPGSGKRGSHILWDHIGHETAKFKPHETAFPWRDGVYVCSLKAAWTDDRHSEKMFRLVEEAKQKLSPFSIQGKASYVNFIDSKLKDWQEAYYGDNYPLLRQIKDDWDPNGVFSFEQGIERRKYPVCPFTKAPIQRPIVTSDQDYEGFWKMMPDCVAPAYRTWLK